MGRLFLAALLLPCAWQTAGAQRTASGGVPPDVAQAITALHNDPGTRRERGAVDIGRDSVVRGTLAVRGGPVVIAGHVQGSLVVINGDLTFRPGARVDGQVYVIGGAVSGRDQAEIGSDFRAYTDTLRYRLAGEDLVVENEPPARDNDDFWRQQNRGEYTKFDFFTIVGSSAYNRVEGYPILLGPRVRLRRDWGSFVLQTRGIVRTAEPVAWTRGTLGHDARTEIRWGNGAGVGIGGLAFDRIDPVEAWHLTDRETAIAAAVIHRDYRDYYGRHGGRAYVSGYLNDDASLTVGYGTERWTSVAKRGPWSLFRDRDAWRPNPAVDEGRARLLTGTLRIDSRNQSYSPGAGWFVQADVERGTFEPRPIPGGVAASRTYARGFVDVRRYNRLAPGAQLNLRVVAGGWLSGDELPLQRRLSVGGPGTLPGFDFRSYSGTGVDRLQCTGDGQAASSRTRGMPALCDRVALVQIEYRGDLHLGGDDSGRRGWRSAVHSPTWLVFADAGRGWRAHDDGVSVYPVESFPALNTFKTDVGIGLDFSLMSVSLAKSLSDRKEPINVVVRLSRRF